MPGYRRVAIAGASGSSNGFSIGQFVADAVLEKKAAGLVDEVLLLGRKGALEGEKKRTIEGFERRGAKYVGVDYADVEGMAAVLKGIEVVLSCVAVQDASAIEAGEPALIRASAKAGVKRFFPSRYDFDDENLGGGLKAFGPVLARKAASLALVKELGMEWTVLVTGFFMNCLFSEFICGWKEGADGATANVVEGGQEIMGCAREDIAKFVAAMITSDPSLTRNRTVRIVSDAWRPGDEIRHYESFTGRKVTVVRHPADVKPRTGLFYPKNLAAGCSYIDRKLWDDRLWPEVKPTSLKDYVAGHFAEHKARM
ncbi:hypothetical protein DFJ74DRAFT_660147 [Hyaloraphidium curvatum]|nr:hypothetical protein DFJ74DRAFT_660147 [Hyaloraphidium curvatum]